MFTLASKADQDKVEEAIANPDGANVSYVLEIDGEDFGEHISSEEGEWGTQEDGVNYCDLVLTTVLPRRLEEAPVRFYVVLNGVQVPQLTGIDSLSEVGEDRASTDPFQSASAGRLANENTLDEEIICDGWAPEEVVRKACAKLPYSRGGVRIQSLGEPDLYFSRIDGGYFLPEQHPSDMFSAVQEKAPYVFRDTYAGGFKASAAIALGKDAIPARTYDADDIRGSGDSDASGWRPPPRTEKRYSRVVVYRRNPDETYAFYQEAPITYRGNKYQPAKLGRTFYVELEDPTGQGPSRAQKLAYDWSERFKKGVYKDELVLPSFDPLLEKGDAFTVSEVHRDSEASYQRMWLGWVETIKTDPSTLLQTLGYEAALVAESKIEAPVLTLGGVSNGILATIGEAVGVNSLGLWINPDYATTPDVWATYTDGELSVDPDLSGGVAVLSGQELQIVVPDSMLYGEGPSGVMHFDEELSWISETGGVLTLDGTAPAVDNGDGTYTVG